jgi:polyhydroxybutyrate depolymerase
MFRRILIILVLIILLAGCSRSFRTETPSSPTTPAIATVKIGSIDQSVLSSEQTRHFILHIPTGYEPGNALALVINFHGYGSNASEEEALTGMSDLADEEGFIVAYPEGLDARWNDGPGTRGDNDLQFVRDLVQSIEGQYSIDAKRIYVTGFSNGGGMANRVGCALADLVAAIATNSGAYNFWERCEPSRPMPVLAFHGMDDNIVPFGGGKARNVIPPIVDWSTAWAARNSCSETPIITTPADGVGLQTWSSCKDNADVELYILENHGHSWPGSSVMPPSITSQAVNATELMWKFFKVHPMP